MFKLTEEELDARSNGNGGLRYAVSSDVEKYVNSYDMFVYYIGNFKLGKSFLSPLREEDDPSFVIYTNANGKLLYHDFLLGGGDIIKFVMTKFNLSFTSAINKIIQDAGLNNKFKTGLSYVAKAPIKHDKVIQYAKPTLKVKRRNWLLRDVNFWKSFHIDKATLDKYRVIPIEYYFYDTKPVKAEKLSYAFVEKKDGKKSYTIYQPLSKYAKWKKSHDSSVFYGWTQLPEKGDILIITKSMKDVMVIDCNTGIPTVALQNEKIKPKAHIIDQLKERFDKIYLLYDNDYQNEKKNKINYGREFGSAIAKEFGLIQIEIPDIIAEMYDAKDISDLAKNAGVAHVRTMLQEDIYNYKV